MEIQRKRERERGRRKNKQIIGARRNMTCNVLILLRYYTYAHIHAHCDIEDRYVYVCVCVPRTCARITHYRSPATHVPLARARIMPFATCTRISHTYVRICIIIVTYAARDTYVSTLYIQCVYNPSTSIVQKPPFVVLVYVRLIEK